MKACVFVGPSLDPESASQELDAIYLPPAAQGDILRISDRAPPAIGLIDGYFSSVPAVWHKEILWAMSRGIHVFGGASMGALRAAELAPFGMEGVGRIFELFAAGELQDDDEVAVAHGTKETGFRPSSEAMVDIRATLERAERADIVSPATREELVRIAKGLFYPSRSYPDILQRGRATALPGAQLDALERWLPDGRWSQKREDALLLVRTIQRRLTEGLPPKQVQFVFQKTDQWTAAQLSAGLATTDVHERGIDQVPTDMMIEELQLRGRRYITSQREVAGRYLGARESYRYLARISDEQLAAAERTLREKFGLSTPQQLEEWRQANDLDEQQFRQLVEEEARLRWSDEIVSGWGRQTLPSALRVSGEYPQLARRVRSKLAFFEEHGFRDVDLAELGISRAELIGWYFESILHQPVPADVREYARSMGFKSLAEMLRVIIREHLYERRPGFMPPG